ncbi:hypothetical protein [Azospirillum sp.]|uniref:hypothetical protein n=1 Tax=Azospirillum sp. TaxID=34012 RepID=UPI003D7075F3
MNRSAFLQRWAVGLGGLAVVLAGLGDAAAAPADGQGIVVYSVEAGSPAAPSPLLRRVQAGGWDLAINPVSADAGRERDDANALIARVQGLKAQGYRRVVLAGEGGGGWVSLLANSSFQSPEHGSGIHAVIALDPHAISAAEADRRLQQYTFINVLKTQDPTRLALFVYEADPDEAETLGAALPLIVAVRTPVHHVAVEPGSAGTADGPRSGAFAERYGPCVLALLAPAVSAPPTACTTQP